MYFKIISIALSIIAILFFIKVHKLSVRLQDYTTNEYEKKGDFKKFFMPIDDKYLTYEGKVLSKQLTRNLIIGLTFAFFSVVSSFLSTL